MEPRLILHAPPGRILPRRKLIRIGLLTLAVVTIVGFLLILGCSDYLLNRFAKPRIEREFAAGHPGWSLQLDRLQYRFRGNRLKCGAVMVKAPKSSWDCRI